MEQPQVEQENIIRVSAPEATPIDSRTVEIIEKPPEFPTLVSSNFDWDRIAACLDSEQFGCVCMVNHQSV